VWIDEVRLPERDTRGAATIAACAFGALFLYRISVNVADPDLYHQMALVRAALESGAVPAGDLFAFTPVHRQVVHHEWGAGVVAFAIAHVSGGAGILALRYALAVALAVVAVRTALRSGADVASLAIAAAPAVLLAEYGFSPLRAQIYTFLLSAITLACIERDRAGDRRWVPLHAALLLLWVNLHGGFVVGPLLLAAYAFEARAAGRPVRHVAALLGVEAVLVVVNPWGPAYYRYLVGALAMARDHIHEWDPLWAPGVPLAHQLGFLYSVALLLYALARGGARDRKGLVLVAVTALTAVRAARMLPIYAVVWFVYCPELLASTARRHARAAAAAGMAGALAFLALAVRTRPWILEVPNDPAGTMGNAQLAYPVGAVRFLEASRFRGKLMTTFETGAYVSWKLYPDVKVSLDGRYEAAYPAAVFDDVLAFYRGERPADIVAKYAPDAVLLPPGSAIVRDRLGWRSVYDDGSFAVLVRPGLALAPVSGRTDVTDVFP
jgi:hypothetical protein